MLTSKASPPSKNFYLESIRGLAALAVFICHLFAQVPEINSRKSHLTSLFSNWGTESVFIFFVLSGLVIHMSFENRSTGKIEFIKSRIIRLHPILIICIVSSVLIDSYLFNLKFSWHQFIGNIIPASSAGDRYFPLYKSNPVIWSLSFELFFYLIFAIFCISNKKILHQRMWIWLGISFISIYLQFSSIAFSPIISYVIKIFSFSCIWLVGFFIWKYRHTVNTNKYFAILSLFSLPLFSRLHILPTYYDPLKYFLFAVGSWPFFQYIISIHNSSLKHLLSKSNKIIFFYIILYFSSITILWFDNSYSLMVKILYLLFPLVALLILVFVEKWVRYCVHKALPPFIYLGTISYSLYLIHFPIIILFVHLRDTHVSLKILFVLVTIALSTYFLEYKLQPFINQRLKKS